MENQQKIKKTYPTIIEVARAYFRIVANINSMVLTDKELELISYLAIQGKGFTKEGFIWVFSSSEVRVNNLVSSLRKKGWLLKDRGTIVLHPVLSKLDFSQPILLNISISNETS